jgi:hypothetical protein
MKTIFTFFLSIFIGNCFAQSFSYPAINKAANKLDELVPSGWGIIDSATGDMNKDGLADAAIVLQYKDSVSMKNEDGHTVRTHPRILAIAFQKSSGGYELLQQSNTFIKKDDNPAMEDPFVDVAINKGVLDIRFRQFATIGSWYVTNFSYKFRYQQGELTLIGADRNSFHRSSHDYDNYSYNFLTKKRERVEGNDNEGKPKKTLKAIALPELKTLKTFTTPFSWEVETDIFL